MHNTLITTVNFNQFLDDMRQGWESLTYEGAKALHEYYDQLADGMGESIEFDPIAIRCEWSEYESLTEAASEYFDFEGMAFDENGDEAETSEEVEEKAKNYLQDRTTVLEHGEGVLIQEF